MEEQPKIWALVGPDNIVINVESADESWVAEWRAANPDTPNRYIATDPYEMGYAGIGYEYEESTGMFVPPMPGEPGDWTFNRDTWVWVDASLPVIPREVLEN